MVVKKAALFQVQVIEQVMDRVDRKAGYAPFLSQTCDVVLGTLLRPLPDQFP